MSSNNVDELLIAADFLYENGFEFAANTLRDKHKELTTDNTSEVGARLLQPVIPRLTALGYIRTQYAVRILLDSVAKMAKESGVVKDNIHMYDLVVEQCLGESSLELTIMYKPIPYRMYRMYISRDMLERVYNPPQ